MILHLLNNKQRKTGTIPEMNLKYKTIRPYETKERTINETD